MCFHLADGTLRQPGSYRHRNSSSRRRAKGDLLQDDEDVEERVDADEEDEAKVEDVKEPAAQPEETAPAEAPEDYWSFPGETIHIHHVDPRTTLFVPTDENCPIPVKYLDVFAGLTQILKMRQNTMWKICGQMRAQGHFRNFSEGNCFYSPSSQSPSWI